MRPGGQPGPADQRLRPGGRGDHLLLPRLRRLRGPTISAGPLVVAREALPDGRTLLEFDDGSIAVTGLSQQPAEAARMGYLPKSARRRGPTPARRPVPPVGDGHGRPAGGLDADHPWVVADQLLDSLLDEHQRHDRAEHGRWWVQVDRGWLQMGTLHDIRFRRPGGPPDDDESLCVVAADHTLPPGDVWSTLVLTATATPDTFFRVANRRARPGPTRAPVSPPDNLEG